MNYEADEEPGLEDLLGRIQTEKDWPVLKNALAEKVQYLIEHRFESLLHLMYRVDIPEDRFREALEGADGEPSERIARLLAHRQLQKIQGRTEGGIRPGAIPDEEGW